MKNLLVALIGILSIGSAVPVIAGDDRQSDRLRNMEQTRMAKFVHAEKDRAQLSKVDTPEKNRWADKDTEMEKMTKGCSEMMKQPS